MGIESSIFIGYGFRIPESYYKDLLRKDPEDDNYYIGDNHYTHELYDENETFIYGKILYDTEARVYFWDGNRDIIDLKKVLKIHHMQKKKIDRIAKKCGTEAIYFAAAMIH